MSQKPDLSKVPVFILAGGQGTRISEESQHRPKPMIEIGGIPMLVHIMRSYYACGFEDFVICAGYKAAEIKQYFLTYQYNSSDLEIDLRLSVPKGPKITALGGNQEKWRVRILDTGMDSMTGSRVATALDRISATQPLENFALTYGDGLTDVDLATEYQFHLKHGKLGTVLGVKNLARFGELQISKGDEIEGFLEKPQSRQGFINGGYFFFRSDFGRYLSKSKDCILERDPLVQLAKDQELRVYKHNGFWYAMDTLRDKNHLQMLWDTGKPPWVVPEFNLEGSDSISIMKEGRA